MNVRSRRWIWAPLIAAISVTAYGADQVLATTPAGFSGITLAKATYGHIYSHMHTVPAGWSELIKTKGHSDLYVQQNTWDPAACGGCVPSTGWHTHPGPSFVIVTQGSLTVYDGDDPTCTPHVYTAGTPDNAFIDRGDGHVHIGRDESGAAATAISVRLVPAGAISRQDAPDPGNCHF
jgi:hypothetical protein